MLLTNLLFDYFSLNQELLSNGGGIVDGAHILSVGVIDSIGMYTHLYLLTFKSLQTSYLACKQRVVIIIDRDNMDRKMEWQNKTTSKIKGISSYGLPHSPTAVSFTKVHQLIHTPQYNSRQTIIFFTFSTFDGEFVVLQNEKETGKIQGQHPSFVQRLRMQTHIPIANCCLQYNFNDVTRKQYLIGFFVDIFSNLYTFNLSTYFQYQLKIKGLPQPILYTTLHYNNNFALLQDSSQIYRQYPMTLTKNNKIITTISLGGTLKLFDLQKCMDKSWINSFIQPQVHQFDWPCLAVGTNRMKCQLGSVLVMVFKNKEAPYVYIDCKTQSDYKNQTDALHKYYQKWQDQPGQITFCQYDEINNLVAVSTRDQSLQFYDIKKVPNEDKYLYCCQKKFTVFPCQSEIEENSTIQYISINKGLLAVVTCQEYILINLQNRVVLKRGKGSKDKSSRIQKLRWVEVLDRDDSLVAFCLIKGYNHHNQSQSKLGKPNIHFKTLDVAKKKNL